MLKKVIAHHEIPTKRGRRRELILDCGHGVLRPGSQYVGRQADCPYCVTADESQGSAEIRRETSP